ncbi:MAG: RNA-binding protein [Devosiaceae bacterium]
MAPATHAQAMKKDEAARERMCIVTRQHAGDTDLIRFVLDPDGVLVPDLKAVLPGRGAWVTGHKSVLAQAIKRKAFGRALKLDTAPLGLDDIEQRTLATLNHHARGALSMARKAGLVVNGFSKVEGALKGGKAHTLLHATDAGADGVMKLDRLAGHVGVPVLRVLPHDEMGLALGLEHVIHAALLDGPGAARFLAPLRRLEDFCLDDLSLQAKEPGAKSSGRSTQRADGTVLGDKTAV